MKIFAKNIVVYVFFLFLIALIASRFLNLDHSARFTRDESSDLARMHEYFRGKKITLVGPISSDNVKVFSSLTYYMLMPFAVAGDFSPVSTAYGTAFFGVLTALLMAYFVKNKNPRLLPLACIFVLFWYPLLESSRWAWNPHLMPFWMILGLIFTSKKNLFSVLLGGICFGLATHNHYIAIIPAFIWLSVESITWIKYKDWKLAAASWFGLFFALLPFIAFDLRHPPGLFVAGYLGSRTPHIQTVTSFYSLLTQLGRNLNVASFTMVRQSAAALALLVLTAVLIGLDMKYKKVNYLKWLLPPIGLIVAGIFLDGFHTRYFLAAIVFYFAWLIQPRIKAGLFMQLSIIVFIILTSIATSISLMVRPQLPPDTYVINSVSSIINSVMTEHPQLKNANITTDMSEDMDMLSEKYRDYLSIKGISFRAASEYDVSEHLFVISQADEKSLRKSVSFPLMVFRNEKLRGEYPIEDTNWKVFWFSY